MEQDCLSFMIISDPFLFLKLAYSLPTPYSGARLDTC